MAEETVELQKGIKVGEVIHREAVVREATLGDVAEGTAEGERLVLLEDGTRALVSSPAMTGFHILRRQVVRIGPLEGPIPHEVMKNLSDTDAEILQNAANDLTRAAMGVAQAGEPGAGQKE